MKKINKPLVWMLALAFLATPAFVFAWDDSMVQEKTEKQQSESYYDQFKKEFYKNINVVDSLIYKNQNDQFNKSLLFISKYTNVSFESRLNYARLYPNGIYEKDRKGWLEWYEKNKCNNIQLKK